MNSSKGVILVFVVAGLLSSITYTSYSNSVPDGHKPAWVAIDNQLKNKVAIFCLGFPSAITCALLVTMRWRWVPKISAGQLIAALVPLYLAKSVVLLLYVLSFSILVIPSLVFAAYLLRKSVEILTSHRPQRFVITLLLGIVVCALVSLCAVFLLPQGEGTQRVAISVFITGTEALAAGVYGRALTPAPATLQQKDSGLMAGIRD